MDSGIIVALVLAAVFFGAIAWLVIHARRQERQAVPVKPDEEKRLDSFARSTRQPSPHVAARAGAGTRHSDHAKLR